MENKRVLVMKTMLSKISEGISPLKTYWDKLGEGLSRLLTQLNLFFSAFEDEKTKEYALTTLVKKAHRDWEEAQALFNEVKDPDMIDHAIYAMEATERRYMFLLKEAKKEKVINEEINQFLN
jgi:hypothetical protein